MHHERPAVSGFSYPIAATYANTPRTPLGSWAVPGKYTVRLTVDGKSQTQPLIVKMDPRVKATAADLKLQYDTSRAIDAMLRRTAAALREIRAAAKTAAGHRSRAAPVARERAAWPVVRRGGIRRCGADAGGDGGVEGDRGARSSRCWRSGKK